MIHINLSPVMSPGTKIFWFSLSSGRSLLSFLRFRRITGTRPGYFVRILAASIGLLLRLVDLKSS